MTVFENFINFFEKVNPKLNNSLIEDLANLGNDLYFYLKEEEENLKVEDISYSLIFYLEDLEKEKELLSEELVFKILNFAKKRLVS